MQIFMHPFLVVLYSCLKIPNAPIEVESQQVSFKNAYLLGTNQKAVFKQGTS